MELGVTFPQRVIGRDAAAARDFAQAAEQLGYGHLRCADHVLGADASHHELEGPYTHEAEFHEPFVLFGHLAAVTTSITMMTSVLILSQRQTALVAKQAAEVDILSDGRLVLGIGTGWNRVEYEAMGVPFEERGPRLDEQIALLRALWSQPLINFEGRFERVSHAGINPRPGQIPIWMGGGANVMMDRVGRVGDGWMVPPRLHSREQLLPRVERIRRAAEAAGRDPSEIALCMSVSVKGKDVDEQLRRAEGWRELGATHFTVSSNTADLSTIGEHIAAIRAFKEGYSE